MTDAAARGTISGREGAKPSRPQPTRPSRPPALADQPLTNPLEDAPTSRALAAWEIASVTITTLVAEWVALALAGPRSRYFVLLTAVAAFAFMLLSKRARGETARDLGWRLDNFARAMRLLSGPMLLGALLLFAAGWLAGSINFSRWRGGWVLLGVPTFGLAWALVQQYALQAFINRRAQIVCGRGARSVLLVSAVFALAHVPNPALVVFTFAGGLVCAHVYQRAPNLPALALAHALMTWVLVSTLPPELLGGLRVGYKYFG